MATANVKTAQTTIVFAVWWESEKKERAAAHNNNNLNDRLSSIKARYELECVFSDFLSFRFRENNESTKISFKQRQRNEPTKKYTR